MHLVALPFSLLVSLSLLSAPRSVHAQARTRLSFSSIPEDLYAFPKYRVRFLNQLPVSNTTAQRWLQEGLRGGENEFLEREWHDRDTRKGADRRTIGGPDAGNVEPFPDDARPDLELLRIDPETAYLCIIPPPPSPPPLSSVENDDDASPQIYSPSKSWEMLQPLVGTCLYHRHGWFTYSYCHGQYVKQFRELPHSHPHPPDGRIPQEDPDWESYTLGVAPFNPNEAELIAFEDLAAANKLEYARGAGQRYLIQRWDDGTLCDKTGQKRKIEVQFHCSMTTTDTILFVKEIATCQYILVIYTPRLCGEPGFKSERDTQEETFLRCREVVDDDTPVPRASLSEPESDEGDEYPRKRRVKPVVNAVQKVSEKVAQKEDPASMIKLALQALMKDSSFGNGEPVEMAHIAVESGDEVYLVDLDVNDLGGDEVSLEEKIRKAIEKEQEGKEQRKKGTKHQVAHDEL